MRFTRFPPFGFAWTRAGKMTVNPEQQKTLRRIVALRKRGLSFRRIGEKLDREGRGPALSPRWSIGMVASLLRRAPELTAEPARSLT